MGVHVLPKSSGGAMPGLIHLHSETEISFAMNLKLPLLHDAMVA